jgi:hypothetical protein
MRKFIFLKLFIFAGLILYLSSAIPASGYSKAKGVKTSYKRYSLFKYKNEDILCEPYIVKKNDWLYKIFKKKGELSLKNFHLFLIIFKGINPKISNIDSIKPGIRILIPLKKVGKGDYDQNTPGNVDVPVIEFSSLPKGLNLQPFIKKHKIKRGENVSTLIHKDFLKKGGGLSKEGIAVFQLANPNIKNINIIYKGDDIYLPDPSIKSQPWFRFLISGKPAPDNMVKHERIKHSSKLDIGQVISLSEYASLVHGTLLSRGKIYFPRKNGPNEVLDLSSTPIINTKDGSKILIISDDNVSDGLLKSIQAHWKGLKIQSISETIARLKNAHKNKSPGKINGITEYKKIIETLLWQTNHTYIPDAKISFMLNSILLKASFGRVIRKDKKDLLINFGIVYGSALKVLEKQKFEIISISPKLTLIEMTHKLFSHLEYATWENPAYSEGKTIKTIHGLYAAKGQDKLFIPDKPLNTDAIDYLKKEGIKVLSTKNKALPQ